MPIEGLRRRTHQIDGNDDDGGGGGGGGGLLLPRMIGLVLGLISAGLVAGSKWRKQRRSLSFQPWSGA